MTNWVLSTSKMIPAGSVHLPQTSLTSRCCSVFSCKLHSETEFHNNCKRW
jgi:hypothetical protein